MAPSSISLDAIRQPAVLFDAGGRIAAANDLAEALAGRPLAGLSAAYLAVLFDVRSPDGARIQAAALATRRALAGELIADLPCTVTLADGRTHEITVTASPVRDGDAVTGALVVVQDVTDRAKAERTLQGTEEMHRTLLGASQDMVLLLGADGTVLAVNEAYARSFGRSPEELGGASIWEVMQPEAAECRRDRFEEVVQTGRPSRFEEARNDRWFDTIVEPLPPGSDGVARIIVLSRDITDRKRIEEALRKREEELQSIFDRSLDAYYRRGYVAGPREYMNPAIETLTGFSPQECLAMSVDEIVARVHPDDVPVVVSAKMEVPPGSAGSTVDYRFRCKDGTYRWFSDRFRIELDGDGRPAAWEGVIRDVDDRKLAEEALRESQARFRDLIETAPDFIWEMDARGRYTYCSPQMKTLWGIEPEEMIGRTPFDLMPPDERDRALEKFRAMTCAPGSLSRMEVVAYDGRGRRIILEISAVPFFSDDGGILGYRGVTRDVTDRKRVDEALRESEERLRLAQEGAGIAIWDRDAATDRVTVAPGFIRSYLLEPEAMVTYADWAQYIHPDDREQVESWRRAAIEAGEPLDLEFRIVIPSGEVRWIQLKGRGMSKGQSGLERVVGVIIDVTERKRVEEELAESEADARAFFKNMIDACAICEMVVDKRGEPTDIRLIDVNPAFEQALSLPTRLIVGQTAFMILPTLHREWLDLFLEVSRNRGFVAVEEPFPALGRRYHVTGFPVRHGRVAVVFRRIDEPPDAWVGPA